MEFKEDGILNDAAFFGDEIKEMRQIMGPISFEYIWLGCMEVPGHVRFNCV